jgi:maleylacetoacetate isomerase
MHFDLPGNLCQVKSPRLSLKNMKLTLYNYYRSSCSYRVRIALHLKKIPFLYKSVQLKDGEQHRPEHVSRNPTGQVPSLEVDGQFINQSMVICMYLDRIQPEPRIFPIDDKERLKVLEICEIINSGIQPIQNLKVTQTLVGKFGLPEARVSEWNKFWIARGLLQVEQILKKTSGEFAVGNQITAADCFILPQIYNGHRFNVDFSDMPTLSRLEKTYDKIEAFKKSHPDAQPDAPKSGDEKR